MKKILSILALASLLTLGGVVAPAPAHAAGQALTCYDNVNNSCASRATTTPAYLLTTNATSTVLTFGAQNADKFDLNFSVLASSTSSKFSYQIYGSSDVSNSTSTANFNWYPIGTGTLTGSVITYAPTFYGWTPATTTVQQLNTSILSIGERNFQIRGQAVGGNLSLYIQAIDRNQIAN